jgi:hypothetical protein
MSARQDDLTAFALLGYNGADNPHIYSSACWYAHSLGQHFRAEYLAEPKKVRMSRGYKVRASDMLFEHDEVTGWSRLS